MKNVFSNVLECIGHTPLVRINRLNSNPNVTLFVKLEARNPGGSIKDRTALYMIEAAEREGTLTPGKIIVEATSGNTGIGLAIVAAVKGYRMLLTMPETASLERQKILKALGAEILLTPGSLGTDGAIEEVYNMVRENPDRYFMPDQFNNPANPEAHQYGTGPEIYDQTDGKVNVVVVPLGTTGTAMGILRAMKERNPKIEVIAVEPYPGHRIQGLKNMKESYVPGIFDRYALDRIVYVKDEEAFETARRLAREEGLFVGMSSGAAAAAAVQIAAERTDGIIVAVLPDGGDRYLSTNLFTTLLEPDFRFFNLLQREKVDFKPVNEGKARVVVTGPTLDHSLNLQESRRFLLCDLLTRFLQVKKFSVDQVIIIPDLDSRTVQSAMAAGKDLASYSQKQIEMFLSDLDLLGIQRAFRYPRISEHLDTIEKFTKILVEKGFAYEKLRSVYFSIARCGGYGALSRMDMKKIRPGTTVDLDAYEKLNPRDFTLLKRATLAELKKGIYLKTDWGNVIPTWHIAAAAAAIHDLGAPIDIQVSSVDFLFPHLENVREIGEAVTGKPFANVWMLCERAWSPRERNDCPFNENSSVRDLVSIGYSPRLLRYWLLSTHYRRPVQVSEDSIHTASHGFARIREFLGRLNSNRSSEQGENGMGEVLYTLEKKFFEALADDLNTPKALAELFKFIRLVNPILDRGGFSHVQRKQALEVLRSINRVLGVFDIDLEPLRPEDMELLSQRDQARQAGRWDDSDRLRETLLEKGIRVLDTQTGSRWERV